MPPIIARVNRRDLKTQLLENKKTITTNVDCPANLKHALIYEDVTPLRSRIMYQMRHRNDKQAYCTHEQAALPREQQGRPHIINTPDDLEKLGFTKEEISNIINNVRN